MPHELTAPITGTVTRTASRGDHLPAGAPVVVLESMKMEYEVVAESGGQVLSVDVAVGDLVQEGTPVALLAPGDDVATPAAASHAALAGVVARHELGLDAARPEAVAKRREQGRRTARENVADLLDPGTFVEYQPLIFAAQERRRDKQELIERTPADGLVGGLGDIDGRPAVVASYDYTVLAGTQGMRNHLKKDRLFELAEKRRLPVVLFAEGGGGRPGDVDWPIVAGLDCRAFHLFGKLSGLVPLVGIAAGYCFAGNAALLGCCDVVIATEDSSVGMGGPAMIEGGGLGVYAPGDVGPIDVQDGNGVVDLRVQDEAAAVEAAKRYLSYFDPTPTEPAEASDLRDLIPEDRKRLYDIRAVIDALSDEHLELRKGFAPGIVTALARVRGPPARDRRQQPGPPRRGDRRARRRQGRPLPPAVRRLRAPRPLPLRHAGLHGRPRRREDRHRPALRPPVRHRRQPHRSHRDDRAQEGLRARRPGDGRGQLQGAAVHGRIPYLRVRRDGPGGRRAARDAPGARGDRRRACPRGRLRTRGQSRLRARWWSEHGGLWGDRRRDRSGRRISLDRHAVHGRGLASARRARSGRTSTLGKDQGMGFDQYHEPPEELPARTRTFARLCASLTEEAEAIGWYEQRIAVEQDSEALEIMRNAQTEEFKHFAMDLEFLLRKTPTWRGIAQGILFKEGDIVDAGEAAEEGAGLGGSGGGAQPGSLGIGSLKGAGL